MKESLKVNVGKGKVMVLGGEERSDFSVVCHSKMVSGKRVAGAIRSQLLLDVYSLSVLGSCMRHCFYLFMVVRQRRGLESGQYKCTSSEVC